jgi:hypothetical protein
LLSDFALSNRAAKVGARLDCAIIAFLADQRAMAARAQGTNL